MITTTPEYNFFNLNQINEDLECYKLLRVSNSGDNEEYQALFAKDANGNYKSITFDSDGKIGTETTGTLTVRGAKGEYIGEFGVDEAGTLIYGGRSVPNDTPMMIGSGVFHGFLFMDNPTYTNNESRIIVGTEQDDTKDLALFKCTITSNHRGFVSQDFRYICADGMTIQKAGSLIENNEKSIDTITKVVKNIFENKNCDLIVEDQNKFYSVKYLYSNSHREDENALLFTRNNSGISDIDKNYVEGILVLRQNDERQPIHLESKKGHILLSRSDLDNNVDILKIDTNSTIDTDPFFIKRDYHNLSYESDFGSEKYDVETDSLYITGSIEPRENNFAGTLDINLFNKTREERVYSCKNITEWINIDVYNGNTIVGTFNHDTVDKTFNIGASENVSLIVYVSTKTEGWLEKNQSFTISATLDEETNERLVDVTLSTNTEIESGPRIRTVDFTAELPSKEEIKLYQNKLSGAINTLSFLCNGQVMNQPEDLSWVSGTSQNRKPQVYSQLLDKVYEVEDTDTARTLLINRLNFTTNE